MGQELVWNIPYPRNLFFTGREELLSHLRQQLQTGQPSALSQPQAISGLGGIGKTQIALQYARQYSNDYQAVLWVRAESHETLTSSFVEIATSLNLPQRDEQDQTITVQAVKRWLQSNHSWLLILDNADEPAIVHEFLPTRFDGHILLTTRAQALGGLTQRIEVDTFTPELGALFLLRRATLIDAHATLDQAIPEDCEVAIQISKELGGLPLALDQAGAYIEETGCHLEKYLERYQVQRAKLLKRRGSNSSDYPASMATTWSLSFERVAQNAVAADLLRLCAFLAPDAIPEEIVIKGASYLGEHLQGVLEDEGLLDEAIAVLRAYSLIRRNTTEKMLSIHRLVQAVLRDAMPAEEEKKWAQQTVYAVNATFPNTEFTQWSICKRCLPHTLACLDLIEQKDLMLPQAALLVSKAGSYLHECARYTQAEPLFQCALAICKHQWGSEHPNTAASLNNLALLYDNQDKHEQAEPLYQRALAIREQQLGPEHPDTATSLDNLAALYDNQGKHEQAELLYQRALTIRERQLGPEHPDTANSLNNLALLYGNQGKYEQAEPLYQRALTIRERQLGPEHPDTAASLNNLAVFFKNQGKYEQAEPLYHHALAICEHQLGPEHSKTATSLNNLAELYRVQGKYEQAEPLYQRALAICEHQLHPKTTVCLNNLAGLYRHQGKYELAEPLYQRILAICEHQLGSEHPETAQSLNNLAVLYQDQGRYEQAEPLHQRALAIRERQLGPEHSDTANSLNNLAGLYHHQGKYEQAKSLYQRALAICEQKFGVEHPHTRVVQKNYISLL